jgi:hypothetical protein
LCPPNDPHDVTAGSNWRARRSPYDVFVVDGLQLGPFVVDDDVERRPVPVGRAVGGFLTRPYLHSYV